MERRRQAAEETASRSIAGYLDLYAKLHLFPFWLRRQVDNDYAINRKTQ